MKFVLISRFFSYNFQKIFFCEILFAITTNHFLTLNIKISKIYKKNISSLNTIQLIEHFPSKFECFQLTETYKNGSYLIFPGLEKMCKK